MGGSPDSWSSAETRLEGVVTGMSLAIYTGVPVLYFIGLFLALDGAPESHPELGAVSAKVEVRQLRVAVGLGLDPGVEGRHVEQALLATEGELLVGLDADCTLDPPRRHLVRTPARVETSRAGWARSPGQALAQPSACVPSSEWAFALVTDRVDPSNAEWRPEPWVRF